MKPPKAEPKSLAGAAAGTALDGGGEAEGTSAAGGADAGAVEADAAVTRLASSRARSKVVPAAGRGADVGATPLAEAAVAEVAVDGGRATGAIAEAPVETEAEVEAGAGAASAAAGPPLAISAGRGAGRVAAATACDGAGVGVLTAVIAGRTTGVVAGRTTGGGAAAIALPADGGTKPDVGLAITGVCCVTVGFGAGRRVSAGLGRSGVPLLTGGPSSTESTVGLGTTGGGGGE